MLFTQPMVPGWTQYCIRCPLSFHLSNNELSNQITTFASSQIPFGIKIKDLPIEISSWLTCLLRNQPSKEQWSKAPTRSKLSHGIGTHHTYCQSDAKMIHSLNISLPPNVTKFSQPMLTPSEKVDLVLELIKTLSPSQSEPPRTMWHRPLSWLTIPTQDWMEMEDLHSFYRDNSATIQTMTNQ